MDSASAGRVYRRRPIKNKKGLFSLFVLGNANLLDRFNLGGCAGLELLNASCGIQNLCLSGIERVAVVADIDVKLCLGRSDGSLVTAYAGNFCCRIVLWVNFCLHNDCVSMSPSSVRHWSESHRSIVNE